MIPVEKKARIVLSVLAGEVSIAEAVRREKISEQSIGRWKAEFLEAGKTARAAILKFRDAPEGDLSVRRRRPHLACRDR